MPCYFWSLFSNCILHSSTIEWPSPEASCTWDHFEIILRSLHFSRSRFPSSPASIDCQRKSPNITKCNKNTKFNNTQIQRYKYKIRYIYIGNLCLNSCHLYIAIVKNTKYWNTKPKIYRRLQIVANRETFYAKYVLNQYSNKVIFAILLFGRRFAPLLLFWDYFSWTILIYLYDDVRFLFAAHYSIILPMPYFSPFTFKLFVHLFALLPRLLSWSESRGTYLLGLQQYNTTQIQIQMQIQIQI